MNMPKSFCWRGSRAVEKARKLGKDEDEERRGEAKGTVYELDEGVER